MPDLRDTCRPAKQPSWGHRYLCVLGIVWVTVLHACSAAFHVLAGALNVDEGFYGVASRAAAHGDWPYVDFGYSQAPLLPFINGALMRLWGFGLFQQRLTNALWAVGALIIAFWLVARRTRLALGLVLVSSFSLLAPWMYWLHLGKTYALSALFVVAATAVFLQGQPGLRRQWALSGLAALGVGTRLPLFPFFAVLWVAALLDGCRPKWPQAVGGLILCFSLVFLPFALANPESFVFWVIRFHAVSAATRGFNVRGLDVLSLAPALFLAASVVIFAWRRRDVCPELILLGAALVATAASLASPGAYVEYTAPLLLPMAIAVLLLGAKLAHGWSPVRCFMVVAALLLVQGVVPPLGNLMALGGRRNLPSWWLTPSSGDYDFKLRERHERIRAVVARFLPPGQPLFGPNLIPALELDRPVPPGLLMGPFSVTRELASDRAHRLHLSTDDDLLALVSDPRVTVISFADRGIMNYGWSMPSFRSLPAGATPDWGRVIMRDFVPVLRARSYTILVRRTSLSTPAASTR